MNMYLSETSCKDRMWTKLVQDRVQVRAVTLAVLKFLVLLLQC